MKRKEGSPDAGERLIPRCKQSAHGITQGGIELNQAGTEQGAGMTY